jgi:two-component system, cell cycle sensor histidine kinase and response regulator CckA
MPGGGALAVRTRNILLDEAAAGILPDARAGAFIKVTVADSGGGIAAEQAPHIFEPFYSTKGPGRGLGLSAAYGIIKQYQGWIALASEPGKGTQFAVYLPEHAASAPVAAAPAPAAEQAGQQQLVLMVEDEPGIMKVFGSILRMKGYRVTEAADVAQARELFAQQAAEIALVFSDILLPDGNGLDLVEELSVQRPGIKIVLTSGYTEDDARLARIKERGYAFLPKPYNMPTLLQILSETLTK